MLLRIRNVIQKELIQFWRDRLLAAFVLLAPALQLVLMAQAIESGINEQPVVILDQDRTPLSRQLIVDLDNSEALRVRYYVDSDEAVRHLLDAGSVRLAVIIPAGFARGVSRLAMPSSPGATVQIITDATNTVAASIAIGGTSTVLTKFSSTVAAGHGLVVPELIDFRTNVRFNPSLNFRNYSVPAQVGFITYQIALAVAALGLARERELGTLEQLMVTPLRRLELTVGKGLPAVAIGSLNFVLMWLIARLVFNVPMAGSLLLLLTLTLLFLTAVVGWGVVLSALSRTQQQAILFVFIQAMVEITFSGFMVPLANMPPFLRFAARFFPLQHYLVIVRGITLKGASLPELWPNALALALLALVTWAAAFWRAARRIE
ncbi:MAG: ABC transporter permease [Anaerolineae bacterium]|nr:ABC transporter permease [Anaerolineae bacterium]